MKQTQTFDCKHMLRLYKRGLNLTKDSILSELYKRCQDPQYEQTGFLMVHEAILFIVDKAVQFIQMNGNLAQLKDKEFSFQNEDDISPQQRFLQSICQLTFPTKFDGFDEDQSSMINHLKALTRQWQQLYTEEILKNKLMEVELKKTVDSLRFQTLKLETHEQFSKLIGEQQQKGCQSQNCSRRRMALRDTIQNQRSEINQLQNHLKKQEENVKRLEQDLQWKQSQLEVMRQCGAINPAVLPDVNANSTITEELGTSVENQDFDHFDSVETENFQDIISTIPTPRVPIAQSFRQNHKFALKLDNLKSYSLMSSPRESYLMTAEQSKITSRQNSASRNNSSSDQSKNPYHDYFSLVTQSAKLNSPHFSKVLSAETSQLYEKLVSEKVPFNKWYEHVSEYLNSQ